MRKRRNAFTLLELLIVVGIIAVLISLLLPAIQSARELARCKQCENNLRQLGLGIASYTSCHSVMPPGVVDLKGPIENYPAGYHYSWVVQILPYISQNNLAKAFNLDHSVYDQTNETAANVTISTLLCPSNPRFEPSHYAGCHHDVEAMIDATNQGVLYLNSSTRYDDVADGLASTFLLGEIRGSQKTLGWASGTRATLRNTGARINEFIDPISGARPFGSNSVGRNIEEVLEAVDSGALSRTVVGGFSSYHPASANFLFCDGSVHRIFANIDLPVYRHLANRHDGELISDDAY
jgi:prepilin-type N-terminal cleavage/methylation domain-containing protein/prepilin-type processing-associated H-X9-DG protein